MIEHEGDCTAGNPNFVPVVRTDIVKMDNVPEDDRSRHIARLTMLWLWKLNDEQKDKLIGTFNEILGIQPILKP
jgi:hypothetical protein